MSNLSISLPDDLSAFEPGSEVEVSLSWQLKSPPARLELRLVWSTAGKGDRDLKVVKTIQIESPDAVGEQVLAIVLPWGPYSFSGSLISLQWGLELVAFPAEQSTRLEITIAPQGREVRIFADVP